MTATLGSYLKLNLLFIQICSLDIGIWCISSIFNVVSCVEHNYIWNNRKRVKFGSAEYDTVHIQFIPTIQAFTNSNPFSRHWDMIYCMYMMYFVYMQQRFLCRAQLNSKKNCTPPVTYSSLIPPIKVFIHSNVLIGCWDMICCVCIMHLVYMQQLLLCRAPWNSRKLQDSHIWLIPNITAVIYSNLFLGHWDMVYVVYIQHSSSCRVQFRSKESKESQIQQCRIWGCAHSVPTIQAFTHPNLFSGRWDMIYCMYRMYRMYLQWRFLCGPQLNSRKLYASHMWLIPNTQADIHSNVFMACWDMVYCVCMMYLVYMQQLLLCRLQLNCKTATFGLYLTLHLLFFQICSLDIGTWWI